jgi:hypothetical protein
MSKSIDLSQDPSTFANSVRKRATAGNAVTRIQMYSVLTANFVRNKATEKVVAKAPKIANDRCPNASTARWMAIYRTIVRNSKNFSLAEKAIKGPKSRFKSMNLTTSISLTW